MTTSSTPPLASRPEPLGQAAKLPPGWLASWPWATFLLPMIVYMVVGSFEPTPPPVEEKTVDSVLDEQNAVGHSQTEVPGLSSRDLEKALGKSEGLLPSIDYQYYPVIYTCKIALTLITMVLVWPGYKTFPWKVTRASAVVGVVGAILWIVLCQLQLEPKIVAPIDRFLGSLLPFAPDRDMEPTIGLMGLLGTGERSAFNPLVQMAGSRATAFLFLAVRFLGLAIIVPVIEEFFLRGFLMRFVVHENWWQVPFGEVNRMAVIVGTAIPMLMHPGELLAAFVWFSMVTWLMIRTRSIWDCVVAHAITNGLLGIYVVVSGEWQLM